MAWQENIELQVFDPRKIGANLLDWFKENQKDALAWANNGAESALPPVLDFFLNARQATRFPVCMINRAQFQTEINEDIAELQCALEYEIAIAHGKADWLAENAPRYAMAFESMTANIPKTRLEKDSKIIFDGVLLSIETTFNYLGELNNKTAFIQVFTTRVNWLCEFSNQV
jgi:hypothetical protein